MGWPPCGGLQGDGSLRQMLLITMLPQQLEEKIRQSENGEEIMHLASNWHRDVVSNC